MARGPIDPFDIRSVKALYVDPLVRNYSELGTGGHFDFSHIYELAEIGSGAHFPPC
jgi:hypothetical protein